MTYLDTMEKKLSYLSEGTKILREAIEDKDYDGALHIITDIKEKRQLSKEQLDFLDELRDYVLKLQNTEK